MFFVLEALEDTIPPLTAFIRDDLRPENEECFTIRILPVDVLGRRELFSCNDDDSGADNYFCEHTICIEDDDGRFAILDNIANCYLYVSEPFVVAFVETTYTVDESVGAVNVCVNLTRPMIDILDERVNVFVIDNSSSVYIPPGAPLASESSPNVFLDLSLFPQLLMNQTFSVYTPWQMGLIMPSRHLVSMSLTIPLSLKKRDSFATISPSTKTCMWSWMNMQDSHLEL